MALAAAIIQSGEGGQAVSVLPGFVEADITITASGSYTTGGDTLDLTAAATNGHTFPPNTRGVPISSSIVGQAGYIYEFAPGSDNTNGKVLVRQSATSAAPLAEISASTYPSGVTGDTIVGHFRWLRG